jgi:stage V sporulation protein S
MATQASTGESHEVLKVSSRSNPNSVAGAVAGVVRQAGVVEVQVVGAGALNQAIKAMAIARGFVASAGIDLVCVPTFADIEIDGERRTAIRICIADRGHHFPAPPLAPVGAGVGNGHGNGAGNGHGRHEHAPHVVDLRD